MNELRGDGIRESMSEAFKALLVALKSLYDFAPGAAVVGTAVAAGLVWLTTRWRPLMTGTAVLLILVLSLALFAIRGNLGEALLSLVGGLLSIFAYSWTTERYVAFSAAWIGFALFAMLIASVKLASRAEDIYKQAALRIAGPTGCPNSSRQLSSCYGNSEVKRPNCECSTPSNELN